MSTSRPAMSSLQLYRGLLRSLRFYPSAKKDSISAAIKEEFREKKDIEGEELEKALWLGQMELKRLQAWVPTGKQMNDGKDMDVKL